MLGKECGEGGVLATGSPPPLCVCVHVYIKQGRAQFLGAERENEGHDDLYYVPDDVTTSMWTTCYHQTIEPEPFFSLLPPKNCTRHQRSPGGIWLVFWGGGINPVEDMGVKC